MVRDIKKIGDPVLRKKAKKIEKVTKDIQKLADDMIETMHSADGLGLAAPQVGISQRMFVVELPKDDNVPGSGVPMVFINPEISNLSAETDQKAEGCLSIPGWRGEVERPVRLTVKGMDRTGNRIKLEVDGMLARAIQHEFDHLEGVLYIDKLISPDRVWRVNENEDGDGDDDGERK